MHFRQHLLLLSLFVVSSLCMAQRDSLVFTNGNIIVGEIKNMEKNVVKVKTPYSDTDFAIEWDGIKEVYSDNIYLIILTNGWRYNGTIQTSSADTVKITTTDGWFHEHPISDIVFLESVDQTFKSRIYASIDFGLSITKANNLRQLTARSTVGYLAENWAIDGKYNTLRSKQDDIDPILRNDGALDYKYYFSKDWFTFVSTTQLSNTELQIKLRSTGNLGFGKYLRRNNKMYLFVNLGASYNNEIYDNPDDNKKSMEGIISSEINLFNFENISLNTKLTLLPSFTESKRLRSDFNFDLKYDLPLDIYIKSGFTLNYDNSPVEGASEFDYLVSTGIGWEW